MSWNDGYERKKFERKQVGQAKRFKDLGMTDEQIQEIYASDLREYRDNRIFSIHSQLENQRDFFVVVGVSLTYFPKLENIGGFNRSAHHYH